jgi:hypothetical protein
VLDAGEHQLTFEPQANLWAVDWVELEKAAN